MVKYCSERCRSKKPGPIDRRIERVIVGLLDGVEQVEGTGQVKREKVVKKGDPRVLVTMDEIEEAVFGSRFDPEKVFGRRKNRRSRVIGGKKGEWKSVDMESESGSEQETGESEDEEHGEGGGGAVLDTKTGAKVRPPQTESEVNFSVGGERGKMEKIEESAVDAEKRHEGQKKAEEREMVRRAARRGVVFGFETESEPRPEMEVAKKGKKKHQDGPADETQPYRRKCEALMQGSVVEPSFAKGNWSIRWRDEW